MRNSHFGPQTKERGFSMIELMIVVTIIIALLGISIPKVMSMTQNVRIARDIRGISAQLALARMRAASEGTKVRLNFNTSANTYQIELWSVSGTPLKPCSAGSSGCAWNAEGGVQTLSQDDTFGFGSISTPAGQQSTIALTSPIYFNSRGLATDSSGNVTATSAIYITNGQGLYSAVAVSITGQPTAYSYRGSAWVAF